MAELSRVDIFNCHELIYEKFISLSQGRGAMVGHGTMVPGIGKSEPRGAGLSPAELTPGTFVTVSESKRIPDRSLVEAIWVIIAVNEAHAVLKFHCGCPTPHNPAYATRIVLYVSTTFIGRTIWLLLLRRTPNRSNRRPSFGFGIAKVASVGGLVIQLHFP
jgi:hypothetical protein